jgi:hypothetical protein
MENLTLKRKNSHINNIKTDLFYHICVNLKIQCHIFHSAVSEKQFLSIHNLAHLFLRKDRQKSNKLNCSPQHIGVLRTFCTSHVRSIISASLRQHGFLFVKVLSNNYLVNTSYISYSLIF